MPLRTIYEMERGVNWYALHMGRVLISKNLEGINDDEILYVHRSREISDRAKQRIETDGRIYQVRKSDYEWFPYQF